MAALAPAPVNCRFELCILVLLVFGGQCSEQADPNSLFQRRPAFLPHGFSHSHWSRSVEEERARVSQVAERRTRRRARVSSSGGREHGSVLTGTRAAPSFVE